MFKKYKYTFLKSGSFSFIREKVHLVIKKIY